MSDAARRVLTARFGFAEFRPGQERVIDALVAGRSALAVFPTGGGKSLCYQVPALLLEGLTVVVSPLIALMKDQIDDLTARGIAAARLDSSVPFDEARAVTEQIRSGELRLLYVAPERFNNERFLALLHRTPIALFAVDEAHCISEWGHNFRPDYLKLARRARELGAERVLALTATATPTVVGDITREFGIAEDDAVVTGFHRPNLTLLTTAVAAAHRPALLLQRLQERPPGSTIVYVTFQRQAEDVARMLAAAGLEARAYHAGMEADDRARVQEWWAASDRAIVVATIAFGMGINKADVRYVYHAALPKSIESYAQEMGRAGRDGAPAVCEVLACGDDVPALENFAYGDTPTDEAIAGVVADVLSGGGGATFDVAEHALAAMHDIRPLVLRTLLTYLELDSYVHQGTPFYAGYRVRPIVDWPTVLSAFDADRAAFLRAVLAEGREGRTWTSLVPADIAQSLAVDRARIVAAIDHLGERGLIVAEASEARQRYTVLRATDDHGAAVVALADRFRRREAAETARIASVVGLICARTCQVAMLVGYFGEELAEGCAKCTACLGQVIDHLPATPREPIGLDRGALGALTDAHPLALGHPRQRARFLCGITSPAATRARLARDPLFGALRPYPFAEVLDWCVSQPATPPGRPR